MKKIAIFHNFMDNIGGAERVSLILARELRADIYTTAINKKLIQKMGFNTERIYSIGTVPKNPPWRHQLAAYRFKKYKTNSTYDCYIIAGDWALSGSIHNKPNIWFIHSLRRELWDLNSLIRKNMVPWYGRYIFDIWTIMNRRQLIQQAHHTTIRTVVSSMVKERLQRNVKLPSHILPPPIDIDSFYYKKNGGYWLSVNRLLTHKRIEMQLEALRLRPKDKLIIVGSYEKNATHFETYVNYIINIKPDNVTILHWVDDPTLKKLYAECKGFITTALNEDFGLTAVEAMASGKPVIAPNEGGYRDTVLHEKTGLLIENINPIKIAEAMDSINNNPKIFKDVCQKHAKKYDTKYCIDKLQILINSIKS